jgi:hypothetical protein
LAINYLLEVSYSFLGEAGRFKHNTMGDTSKTDFRVATARPSSLGHGRSRSWDPYFALAVATKLKVSPIVANVESTARGVRGGLLVA